MYVIYGEVPSSKNSKQWTGKFLVHSKPVKKYILETKEQYRKLAQEFRKELKTRRKKSPYYVKFTFYRKTKRAFDYTNILQIVADSMTAKVFYKREEYKIWGTMDAWIPDDSADWLIPVFAPYVIDKENPRVEIEIL